MKRSLTLLAALTFGAWGIAAQAESVTETWEREKRELQAERRAAAEHHRDLVEHEDALEEQHELLDEQFENAFEEAMDAFDEQLDAESEHEDALEEHDDLIEAQIENAVEEAMGGLDDELEAELEAMEAQLEAMEAHAEATGEHAELRAHIEGILREVREDLPGIVAEVGNIGLEVGANVAELVAQAGAAGVETEKDVEKASREVERAMKEVERELKRELPKAAREVEKAMKTAKIATAQAAANVKRTMSMFGAASARPIVIRSGKAEPEELAALVEDMTIMSRILDKSLEKEFPKDFQRSSIFGFGGTQGLYLDGYGLLFVTAVKFPLVAPDTGDDSPKTSEERSLWEETRRELEGKESSEGSYDRSDDRVRFDAAKVEQLENALLEVVKMAANIQALKPQESVTIAVFERGGGIFAPAFSLFGGIGGGNPASDVMAFPAPEPVTAVGAVPAPAIAPSDVLVQTPPTPVVKRPIITQVTPGDKPKAIAVEDRKGEFVGGVFKEGPEGMKHKVVDERVEFHYDDGMAAPTSTVLTLRVQKSDVDAFAKGSLPLEEFRKRATILAY